MNRELCNQQCGADSTGYWIDPIPNGWGGWYCENCGKKLHFSKIDSLPRTDKI